MVTQFRNMILTNHTFSSYIPQKQTKHTKIQNTNYFLDNSYIFTPIFTPTDFYENMKQISLWLLCPILSIIDNLTLVCSMTSAEQGQ